MLSETAEGRLAVVGRADMIIPFRAAGLKTVPLEPGPEVAGLVEALIDDGYQVIFFTEELFPFLAGLCDRYSDVPVPCLVPLPSGSDRSGLERLRAVVRQALGVDVLGSMSIERKGASE